MANINEFANTIYEMTEVTSYNFIEMFEEYQRIAGGKRKVKAEELDDYTGNTEVEVKTYLDAPVKLKLKFFELFKAFSFLLLYRTKY